MSSKSAKRETARAMGDRQDRGRVLIQLSEEQVDVVLAAAPDSKLTKAHTHSPGESTEWIFRPLMDDKSCSRSLLIGLEILTCFPLDGTERGIADVANQLNINSSTVHRYISTLLRVGLLERNPDTRLYRVAGTH